MEVKNEKETNVNIYEIAGKVGKKVKKYSGYAVAIVITIAIPKGIDIIKRRIL
jgi:hypothetical protein